MERCLQLDCLRVSEGFVCGPWLAAKFDLDRSESAAIRDGEPLPGQSASQHALE
jgi:hypothetical protein